MGTQQDHNAIAAAEIEARIGTYVEELTSGRDPHRASGYYTADAKLIGPGMNMSRADLLAFMRGVFDAGVAIRVHRRTVELFVHGDVAYELATAEDTLASPDGIQQVIRNNMFIRWEKGADGLWRFARVLLSPQLTTQPSSLIALQP
jgi:ketosteroid isomerase-like protein